MDFKNNLFLTLFLILFLCLKGYSQIRDYNYESWKGKNTEIKSEIVISDSFIEKHKFSLAKGYQNNYVLYRMPMYENDTLKTGEVKFELYSNPKEAQLALVDFLNCMSSGDKPPRLDDKMEFLDVVFGEEFNGVFKMYFTKNNVFIVLHAPEEKALQIAKEIADNIATSPGLNRSDQKPKLVFTK